MLDRHLGHGTTFLDTGAWIGPLSLYAASRGARVVAVEADPAALAELWANVGANPTLSPRVEIIERALALKPGTVRMGARRKPGDSMSSTLLPGSGTSWDAQAITPAELAGHVAGADSLVVKLDIEGGEAALLPALVPAIARPGCTLLVSLHPQILSEAGDPDPAATLVAALGALASWRAARLEDGRWMGGPVTPDAVLRADLWLFQS